jgi:hypothetical protein
MLNSWFHTNSRKLKPPRMNHWKLPTHLSYYEIIYGGTARIYIGPSMTLAADEFVGNMHIFEMTPRDLHMGGSIYHLDRNKSSSCKQNVTLA